MSTAVATAPGAATTLAPLVDRRVSPRPFAAISAAAAAAASSAPPTAEPAQKRARSTASPDQPTSAERSKSTGKRSPLS